MVARVLALDTTPPAITVPANVTVDATGPRVRRSPTRRRQRTTTTRRRASPARRRPGPCSRSATRRSRARRRTRPGTRRPPGSSSTSAAASEQIVRLIDKTVAFLDLPALKPALKAALQSAADATLARNPRAACLALNVYIAAVQNAPARAFTPAERSELIADARRIKAVIGC